MSESAPSAPESAPDTWPNTRLLMRRPWLEDLPALRPLPEGYTLRRYRPDDSAALALLLSRAFAEPGLGAEVSADTRTSAPMPPASGAAEPGWDEALVRVRLSEAPDVLAIFVVDASAGLVATASARLLPGEFPDAGYVHWVAADPAMQGTGLGALVTRRVLEHFAQIGLGQAVLETQTPRLPAIRSYLRMGFVPEYRDQEEQRRWAGVFARLLAR